MSANKNSPVTQKRLCPTAVREMTVEELVSPFGFSWDHGWRYSKTVKDPRRKAFSREELNGKYFSFLFNFFLF